MHHKKLIWIICLLGILNLGVTSRSIGPPLLENNSCQLAFFSRTNFRDYEEYYAGVYIFDLKTAEVQPLRDEAEEIGGWPVWSHNGNYIAFASKGSHPSLFIFDIENNNLIQKEDIGIASDLNWSPDDNTLMFALRDKTDRTFTSKIHIFDIEEDTLRPLFEGPGSYRSPQYSPDGQRIIFSVHRNGVSHLGTVELDGSNVSLFTQEGYSPQWSPDGTHVAFNSHRTGNEEIFITDADGSNVRNLTNHPARDRNFVWSPDGLQIALVSDRNDHNDIFVLTIETGDIKRITDDEGDDNYPVWSPNGNLLAYTLNIGSSYLKLTDFESTVVPRPDLDTYGTATWSPLCDDTLSNWQEGEEVR